MRFLEEEKVDYLLIGGYAVGYYGYPRATADMDIWIGISRPNACKVVSVLKKFGLDSTELVPELFLDEGKVIRIGVPPIRIEIQTRISGVDFETCHRRLKRANFDGIEISIISLADLRANKAACGRHKDLDDLEHLPADAGV